MPNLNPNQRIYDVLKDIEHGLRSPRLMPCAGLMRWASGGSSREGRATRHALNGA
jgi:hypothetical protein